MLTGLLGEHSATANKEANGEWEIAISLDGAPRGTVPDILHIVADWLDECGLRATKIALDNHTHLITADHTGLAGASRRNSLYAQRAQRGRSSPTPSL